jgi:hypothetical protein
VFALVAVGIGALGYYLAVPRSLASRLAANRDIADRTSSDSGTADKPYEIGQYFVLGSLGYVVNSASRMRSIGNEFSAFSAGVGGSFVVVRYSITNLSNATVTVLRDDLRLVDSKNREFRPSSNAQAGLAISAKQIDFVFAEVQPGLVKEMATAFEVPLDALKSEVALVIPKIGSGSTAARVVLEIANEEAARLAQLSSRSGMSANVIEEWRFVGEQCGALPGAVDGAIEVFARKIGDARAGKGTLHALLNQVAPVFLKQLKNTKSNDEAFDLMIRAIQKIEDPTRRLVLGSGAFGEHAFHLINVAKVGPDAIKGMRARARESSGD